MSARDAIRWIPCASYVTILWTFCWGVINFANKASFRASLGELSRFVGMMSSRFMLPDDTPAIVHTGIGMAAEAMMPSAWLMALPALSWGWPTWIAGWPPYGPVNNTIPHGAGATCGLHEVVNITGPNFTVCQVNFTAADHDEPTISTELAVGAMLVACLRMIWKGR